MIKFKNIKIIWLLFIGALLVVACESSDTEVEKDFEEVNQVEDLLSSADTSNETEPLLTMHFDADLSEEEVKIEFEKAVENYLNSQSSYASKTEGFSTEWYTRLFVWTGTGIDEGTSGSARTSIWFNTSAGMHRTYVDLDNGRTTERQGGIDAYLIKSSIEDTPVETVSISHAFLYLTGNDDWFVTHYNAYVFPDYQTTESTGGSWLTMQPNVWLVSDTATGSDVYYTGRETGYSGDGLQFEGEFISVQVNDSPVEVFSISTEAYFSSGADGIDFFDFSAVNEESEKVWGYATLSGYGALSEGVYNPGAQTKPFFTLHLPSGLSFNERHGIPTPTPAFSSHNLVVTVINSGQVGEFMDITLSGEFTDVNGDMATVLVTIHIIRK